MMNQSQRVAARTRDPPLLVFVHRGYSTAASKGSTNVYGGINKIAMSEPLKDAILFGSGGFKPSVPEILTIALTAVKY